MHQPLVPHQSSTHRLACLSLYKALLKHSLTVSTTHSGGLRSLIRCRFKTDRLLQSPSQIANGLNAGNEVLKLLCASARGESSSIARLSELIESTLELSGITEAYRNSLRLIKKPPSSRRAPKANNLPLSANKTLQSRRPDSSPIFERPLPLSQIRGGKRRVPKFVAAQGVPFLLYSKPQPQSLGRLLRQKIAWQHKKWDQRTKLTEETIPLGVCEDAWDALVASQEEVEGHSNRTSVPEDRETGISGDSTSWNSAPQFAAVSVGDKIRSFERRNLETGRRLFEILKQERVLVANEKEKKSSHQVQNTVI
ncbi:hypothetical protein EPUS_07015 [Endocarpon pusillum Z07020]|uniref:Complex 1 LYR protein domain-containing protein n=1 Tax=Endocarpon pusillum (strain Z07020 / HMAS-L-300199) TaxID=1263415 RepID=U1GSU7_ENDPU|nr:uncharacterized protein EPUS_07015 [Endocarpon pusillum Z07020]ERF75483.1 hypothetical protein EPUS_07015 [Endocarpon pusillum Z07020]